MSSEAAAALWRNADLIAPMALRVAATLGLADSIAAGRTTVAALAAASGCDRDSLERLVRYLTLEGVFTTNENGELSLGPIGACLRGDHPSGARNRLDLEGFGGRMDRCMFEMLEAVRSGEPVWDRLYGSGMWEDMDGKPALAESFNRLMAARTASLYPHIVEAYSWSQLGRVVDVGGGTGALLAALAARHRGLEGEVIDLPAAVDGARRRFAASGLEGRLSARAGNFFEALPAGADAYLLSSVIHDWNDEQAARLLRRCAEAAGTKGRILIVDSVLGGNDARSAVTAMDLRMLLLLGGRERSLADYETLVHRAGLRIAAVEPLPVWEGQAIIDCRRLS